VHPSQACARDRLEKLQSCLAQYLPSVLCQTLAGALAQPARPAIKPCTNEPIEFEKHRSRIPSAGEVVSPATDNRIDPVDELPQGQRRAVFDELANLVLELCHTRLGGLYLDVLPIAVIAPYSLERKAQEVELGAADTHVHHPRFLPVDLQPLCRQFAGEPVELPLGIGLAMQNYPVIGVDYDPTGGLLRNPLAEIVQVQVR